MILFGLAMERANADRISVDWAPFIYGCLIGAVPWIAIIIQFVLAETSGRAVPGIVYRIFVSLFLLFNCFWCRGFADRLLMPNDQRSGSGNRQPSA